MQTSKLYVSITGLRVTSFYKLPKFWFHATRSMVQARSAPGCLQADARLINGVHHTLSVWESKTNMLEFLRRGAHLEAMKQFRSFATGKTFGFESESIPDWPEVHKIWNMRGEIY